MTIKEWPTSCSSDMPSMFHTKHVPIMCREYGVQGWKQIPNGVLQMDKQTGELKGFLHNGDKTILSESPDSIYSLLAGKEAQKVLNDKLEGNMLQPKLSQIKFGSSLSLYGTDSQRPNRPEASIVKSKFQMRQEQNCQGGTGKQEAANL